MAERSATCDADSTARRRAQLLSILADAQFHSGAHLARSLRVSRSAVWKLIGSLRELGIDIEALPRVGYRLPTPVDLLDEAEIARELLSEGVAIEAMDIPFTLDSTNRFLLDAPAPQPKCMRVCMTELQTSGRGRRGRSWTAPFGSGLCMSVSWQFVETPPEFSALGLVVGIAAVRSLTKLGATDVKLKWPNDLVWRHRKLGGILIEIRGESGGPAKVVIGMGINVRMPVVTRLELAKQNAVVVADLHEIVPHRMPTRSALAGAIISELARVLPLFATDGLAPFLPEWQRFDAIVHTQIKVFTHTGTVLGQAHGIAADGSLLVEVDGRMEQFVSGEVSVRSVNHNAV